MMQGLKQEDALVDALDDASSQKSIKKFIYSLL